MSKPDTLHCYNCSKCGKQLSSRDQLLKGCSCGNKLFRLVNSKKEDKTTEIGNTLDPLVQQELLAEDVAHVKILADGVFLLDIDGLCKNTGKEPIIISAGGIYKLLNPSKL